MIHYNNFFNILTSREEFKKYKQLEKRLKTYTPQKSVPIKNKVEINCLKVSFKKGNNQNGLNLNNAIRLELKNSKIKSCKKAELQNTVFLDSKFAPTKTSLSYAKYHQSDFSKKKVDFKQMNENSRTINNRKKKKKFKKQQIILWINSLKKAQPEKFCLVHINKTKNNTHCIISNLFGRQKTLWSTSGGTQDNKVNGRRKTRYIQRMVAKSAIEKLLGLGLNFLVLHCKGTIISKRYILKTFSEHFTIILFKDLTSIPHNGCRPSKMR